MSKVFSYRQLDTPLDVEELLSSDTLLLLSVAKSSSWQVEAEPEALSCRAKDIPEVIGYVKIKTVQEVRKVVKIIEGEPYIVVDDNIYLVSGSGGANHLYFESYKLEHQNLPTETYRILGLHKDVTLLEGVDAEKTYFGANEVVSSTWFYAESFRPISTHKNLVQTFQIVIKADSITPGLLNHATVKLDLQPPIWFAFRDFETEITAITDGHIIEWQQVRGPTLVIDSPDKMVTNIERPEINDDPYIVRATVQKLFADDLSVIGYKDLPIYTTPASPLNVVCKGTGWASINEQLWFVYWFLPLEDPATFGIYRTGDTININWSVSGNIDVSTLTNYVWSTKNNNDWVESPTYTNTYLKSFGLELGKESKIKCAFLENQIYTERYTDAQKLERTTGLAQSQASVRVRAHSNLTFIEQIYTTSVYSDDLVVRAGGNNIISTLDATQIYNWVGSNSSASVKATQLPIFYQDVGLSVGGT